jgi:hypothetical protein
MFSFGEHRAVASHVPLFFVKPVFSTSAEQRNGIAYLNYRIWNRCSLIGSPTCSVMSVSQSLVNLIPIF